MPLALLAVVLAGLRVVLLRRFEASKAEQVQTLFIFFLVVMAVLTITGVWFRGPGMQLMWAG